MLRIRPHRDRTPLDAHRVLHVGSRAYAHCAQIPADPRRHPERGPGALPGPAGASSCRDRLGRHAAVVERFFFRRFIGVRRRAAKSELLPAVDTGVACRLVFVRLDLGVQAHRTILIDSRGGVLSAERIVDDLVVGKECIVLTLGPNAASIPTDVVGLLDRRKQLERALRGEMGLTAPIIMPSWSTNLATFGSPPVAFARC